MKKYLVLASFMMFITLFSCNKDEEIAAPIIEFNQPEEGYIIMQDEVLQLKPTITSELETTCMWIVNNEKSIDGKTFDFVKTEIGEYTIKLIVKTKKEEIEKRIIVKVVKRPIPIIEPLAEKNKVSIINGEIKLFSPIVTNKEEIQFEWALDDEVVSKKATYTFESSKKGIYTLKLKVTNKYGEAEIAVQIEVLPNADDFIREITTESKAYPSSVLDIKIAPGQYANKFTSKKEAMTKCLAYMLGNDNNSYPCLGTLGGYITVGFDHSIKNIEKKEDFVIQTNYMSGPSPAIIWVSQDANGNGKADDKWYRIKGSVDNDAIENYTITYHAPSDREENMQIAWTDNKGGKGVIPELQFMDKSQYPKWEENSYSINLFKLKTKTISNNWGGQAIDKDYYGFGYANLSGSTNVKIEDAVNEKNETVSLKHIDFVKVQNGVLANLGMMNEARVDLKNIKDLNIVN